MICRVVTVLSILSSISAHRSDDSQRYAVSSQSFQREDVPLSYQFSAIHSYKQPNTMKSEQKHDIKPIAHKQQHLQFASRPLKYSSIQYAPLPFDAKNNHDKHHDERGYPNDQKRVEVPAHLIHVEDHVNSSDESLKRDHLEPQKLKNNLKEHKQEYRSYVPPHDLEIIPKAANNFVRNPAFNQNEQGNKHKLIYYRKSGQNEDLSSPPFVKALQELPTSEDYNLLGLIPQLNSVPIYQKKTEAKHTLHDDLVKEKSLQSYQHVPRLHMNVARIYSIANSPHSIPKLPVTDLLKKTHLSNANIAKPTLFTQAFFLPNVFNLQKTIMHPVDNQYRHHPAKS